VNGKFFTFPLCVLAMPLAEKQILMHIISHALDRAGENAEVIDKTRILKYVSEHGSIGYNGSDEHDKFIRGAIVTNVKLGWIKTTVDECAAVKRFVDEHQRKHGTDPLVFIAAELFWSCNDDNQDFSFRGFSTACAVNSVIGFKKTPVIIRRAMIIARQLGDTFESWTSQNGESIERLMPGEVSADNMVGQMEAENTHLTWILRLVGFLLMAFGIGLVIKSVTPSS